MLWKQRKFKKHTNYFQLIVTITTMTNKIMKLYNLKKKQDISTTDTSGLGSSSV